MTRQEETTVAVAVPAALTRKDLEGVFKVSGRTIDRLVASGRFPRPFHVGRSRRWRPEDILGFIGTM